MRESDRLRAMPVAVDIGMGFFVWVAPDKVDETRRKLLEAYGLEPEPDKLPGAWP